MGVSGSRASAGTEHVSVDLSIASRVAPLVQCLKEHCRRHRLRFTDTVTARDLIRLSV